MWGEFVSLYLRGNIWWVRYQIEGRQQRESLFTRNRKKARRKASIINADLLRGLHQLALPPVAIDRVVVPYLESLELKGNSSKTIRDYRRILNQMSDFAKSQNRSKLHQLDLQFVDAYRKFRKESRTPEIQPKTIFKEVAILRSLMLFALSRKLIRDDPLLELNNPKPKSTPQPVWTPEEQERILNSAEEPHDSIYTILADTGMRIGELAWLT